MIEVMDSESEVTELPRETPDRFRLVIECDVEITDRTTLQAALVQTGADDHEAVLTLAQTLTKSVMTEAEATGGLEVHSAFSIMRIAQSDGSYKSHVLLRLPPVD